MIRLPNAKNSGVAKNSNMIVPCMVNSWLYCSGERNCSPGRAISPRISMAITPPTTNQKKDVAVYSRPMVLWSVVRSRLRKREPLVTGGAALGRETIGCGASAVIACSQGPAAPLRLGSAVPMVDLPSRSGKGDPSCAARSGSGSVSRARGRRPGGHVDGDAVRRVLIGHQPVAPALGPGGQPRPDLQVEGVLRRGGRGTDRPEEGQVGLRAPGGAQHHPAPRAPVPGRRYDLPHDRAQIGRAHV